MMQTFDTQLAVSLRALREVVAPALQQSEAHVIEQLNLAIATLDFARQRLPYARPFHRYELQSLIEFSDQVAQLITDEQADLKSQLQETAIIADAELARAEAEVEDYLIIGRKLRDLIARAIRDSQGESYEQSLNNLIICQQKELLRAQRAWCSPFGLDPRVGELPSLEELLSLSNRK